MTFASHVSERVSSRDCEASRCVSHGLKAHELENLQRSKDETELDDPCT